MSMESGTVLEGPVYLPIASAKCDWGHAPLQFINIMALNDPAVASRLRAYRKLRGYSKHSLAKRSGVSVDDISMAETKPWEAPLSVFVSLCGALRIDLYELSEDLAVVFSPSASCSD